MALSSLSEMEQDWNELCLRNKPETGGVKRSQNYSLGNRRPYSHFPYVAP